ncbi:uncharacterized protein CEXT_786751 [Caerostris extrusa]|uniref:VWFD domain-containing protein n=1 Tax=Caerostris extrusa TaxID=172846 RepID=A0AAV4MCK4_CAEEX|nr:uncharacterized protein CEXT_786751 [Caerostris extrusa]
MKGLSLNATYIDKLTDEPLVDFVLHTPTELITFRRSRSILDSARIKHLQCASHLCTALDQQHLSSIVSISATCTVMEKYIRTYDMKTYHVPKTDDCPYLMTSHCMEHKKFAVLVHFKQDQRGVKKVILHIGTHTVEMTPGTKSKYSIKYDGRQLEVKDLRPVLLDKHELIYAVTNKASDGSYYIEIHCESAAVTVKYDGTNVKTYVDPRYKGELCGLCSEFNGEVVQEMRGPNKCLYSSIDDFVKSTMVGTCGDKTPQHPHICGEEEVSSERLHADFDESGERKEYVPRTKRNRAVARGKEICFSIKPVPACENNDTGIEFVRMISKFHCMPKSESNSKKLLIESRRRILGELENKSEDWTDTLSYPKNAPHLNR